MVLSGVVVLSMGMVVLSKECGVVEGMWCCPRGGVHNKK